MVPESGLKIAVIGGGVAGIASAYLLQRRHAVTLYEKNDYVGGHTHTVVIEEGSDAGTSVDTGFIVFNDRTYPLFNRFLSQLEVPIRKTPMSFSYTSGKTGLQYASSNFNTIFAQRLNLLRPSFWHMLLGIMRLNSKTRQKLQQGQLEGLSLGEYLRREGFSQNLIEEYLVPMAAAIWSTPDVKMMDFPAEAFFRFFENHGLLTLTDQPQWYVVAGGSHSYVKAFLHNFTGRILTNNGVTSVRRTESGPVVRLGDGREEEYDRVVIAAHANEAYRMLADPSEDEIRLLSPWQYANNHTVLHTDISLLPSNRRARASWNYARERVVESGSPVTVTYHMNRLQHLKTERQYCVTLNPVKPIPGEQIIREIEYTHPMFTFEALETQKGLPGLNGQRNTYFCGSYCGYGFHEDAVRSAVTVAEQFGIDL
ncbi:MAG: FAD-dependent oxidoreductase [Chrysiogenales bacterium]|nr:MAG: FAD-dependent oxidoreductase [Chrysiogenales bacterium]